VKSIIKKKEPVSFKRWKTRNKSSNWNSFSGTSEHTELGHILVEEQLGMCAYCEISLSVKKRTYHIEHLCPKGNPSGRMYSLGEVNFIQGILDLGNCKNSVRL